MEYLVKSTDLLPYYKNRRVFVTGHTGFKGSWLTAALHLAGARIVGYALPSTYTDSLFQVLEPLHLAESTLADIRDKKGLEEAIENFQPEFIFHLAAQPLVRRSYEVPAETFEVNVVGTANVLETVRKLPSKCSVAVITTDKVYENKELDILYSENDNLGGYDPYSASKACTELVVQSFRNSFFNPSMYHNHQKGISSARAGNVLGGGDRSTDRIIPDIVRSLESGKTIKIRNAHAIRPWQHVLESIAGYLQLGILLDLQPTNFSKAYNFGPLPNDHLTVGQLVEKAIECWGSGSWTNVPGDSTLHEAGILKLDISRAMKELDWKPRLNSSLAIKLAIEWYKQPREQQAAFTFKQIKDYFLS